MFNRISNVPGVCSAVTIHSIHDVKHLSQLSKNDIYRKILTYCSMNPKQEINVHKIKTVIIFLNVPFYWHWFTPWKKAYSYKGNGSSKCRMFYINYK